MTTVLGVDQGTSGTKAVVVDGDDRLLAVAEVPLYPRYLSGGGVEQDPQALLNSVLEAGRAAVARAGVRIDIVSIANQGESVLAWDSNTGHPLSPVIVWQDKRAESICGPLRPRAHRFTEHTGLPLDPYFSGPKLAWLRASGYQEGVVTTTDSWLIYHLTGAFVTDVSTASRSLMLRPDASRWDLELLEAFSLADERLPEIVPTDAIVGETNAFGGTAAVGGLVIDQQAALLAQRCLIAGEAKCTFGTGAFLLASTGKTSVRSGSGLASSVAWERHGVRNFCLDGQVYTAASSVRWLQRLGFIDQASDLDSVAADDAEGVLCVPAFTGLGAPWWRPDATASFTGITLATGREHLVRAVLDGIAAQVAQLTWTMAHDLGRPFNRLRVDGGLTQSRALMQRVSDLLGVPIDIFPSQHATPLGGVALARCAIDDNRTLSEAIVPWSPATTFEPRWSAGRAAEFQAQWSAAAELSRHTES